jgi:hypothetical protein
MSYLHYRIRAGPDKLIHVKLSATANVRLLDTLNYFKYRAGKPYKASGEALQDTVVNLQPPHKAEWHLIVDLKGQGTEVRAFVELLDSKTGS